MVVGSAEVLDDERVGNTVAVADVLHGTGVCVEVVHVGQRLSALQPECAVVHHGRRRCEREAVACQEQCVTDADGQGGRGQGALEEPFASAAVEGQDIER